MSYSQNLGNILSHYDSSFHDYSFMDFHKSVVLPPPNVTGNLHIGHAMNMFLQDAFIRSRRFCGEMVRWVPGTDHAGVGTQILVKNKLAADGLHVTNDQELLKHLWSWTEKYKENIGQQMREMRVLFGWPSYRFTLDEDAQKAVTHAFCLLYDKGLIFRDKRMVNWDLSLQTVLSDIEINTKEIDGKLWYISYESEDGHEITIATTRPETIFADECIAVHPDDPRYTNVIGKHFRVPLIDKLVPVVTDTRCDMSLGSGAVKIDPSHGFLDFEIAKAHNMPIVPVINTNGRMCGDVPLWVAGLDRFVARAKVVEKLTSSGNIVKVENVQQQIPHGIRSDSILEPIVTEQWFLDMPKLADLARAALDKYIELLPPRFRSVYTRHMDELQPWCISRQIVWGHKIPAWYDGNRVYVAHSHEEASGKAGTDKLVQDPDVLDTWFSSALWPMITSGWPNKVDPKFYPNAFLVTGSDILFFWVTKMIMMHVAIHGDTPGPFNLVYLHGLVQDARGLKMSKSKGNVVDPIELLQEYGRDVVSFALVSSAVPGQNIKFGNQNLDKSKKFLNKIWNAFRFCLDKHSQASCEIKHDANIWILSSLDDLEKSNSDKISRWNLYEAANELYDTFWDSFCDWYIEVAKYLLNSDYADETKYTIYLACYKLLRIMHPFLPLVTEYFWQELTGKQNVLESSPVVHNNVHSQEAIDRFEWFKELIRQIRSIKSHFQVADADLMLCGDISQVYIGLSSGLLKNGIRHLSEVLEKSTLKFGCSGVVLGIMRDQCAVPDIKANFDKIIHSINREIDLLESKLNDHGFMSNASPTEIAAKKAKLQVLNKDKSVYESAMHRL